MKNKLITPLSSKELLAMLKDERERLARMQFNQTVAPIENPGQIKATKITIARILTELRKRQLEAVNK